MVGVGVSGCSVARMRTQRASGGAKRTERASGGARVPSAHPDARANPRPRAGPDVRRFGAKLLAAPDLERGADGSEEDEGPSKLLVRVLPSTLGSKDFRRPQAQDRLERRAAGGLPQVRRAREVPLEARGRERGQRPGERICERAPDGRSWPSIGGRIEDLLAEAQTRRRHAAIARTDRADSPT